MPRYKDDANAFLMGGEKVPSCSFLKVGDSHEGEILDLGTTQQRDAKTKEPLFWPDGKPKMQAVITIQTDETDPEIEDDDGRRRVFAKWKLRDAIAEAVREADAQDVGIEVGGWIKVTYVKQDKPTQRGLSGVKHYSAEYEPPDPARDANTYLQGDDDEGEADDFEDDEPEPEPTPAPTRGRGRARTTKAEAEPAAPARGRGRRAPAAAAEPERPSRSRRPAASSAGSSRRSQYVSGGEDDSSF